jgi:hypothetical protein
MNRVLSTLIALLLLLCLTPLYAQETTVFSAHYSVRSVHKNKDGTEKTTTWVESCDLIATETSDGYHFKKVTSIVENHRITPLEVEESDGYSAVVINTLETLRFSYVTHPNNVSDKTFGHVTVLRKGESESKHPLFVVIEKEGDRYLSTMTILLPEGEKIVTKQRYGETLFDLPLYKHVTHFAANGAASIETHYTILSLSKK